MIEIVWDISPDELNKPPAEINYNRYVYYDSDSGDITAISNQPNEYENPFLSLTYDDVKAIFEGTASPLDYKVVFSPDQREFVMIRKEEQVQLLEQKSKVIYQIPGVLDLTDDPVYDPLTDIVIIQDVATLTWKYRMSNFLRKSIYGQRFYFDKVLEFYITKHNDPNVLYYTQRIPLNVFSELAHFELPFNDFDYTNTPYSIFTRKTFGRYLYIRNEHE
jgi:hypothetical protein